MITVAVAVLFSSSTWAESLVGADAAQESRRLTVLAFEHLRAGDEGTREWNEAYEAGIEAAQRAIALDEGNANAHYALFCNLGRHAERSGVGVQMMRLGRLRESLERTIELAPRHAHAWEALGEMLLRLPFLLGGSTSKGLKALRRSAELDPTWFKPHLTLAEHFHGEGDDREAKAAAVLAERLATKAGEVEAAQRARKILDETSDS